MNLKEREIQKVKDELWTHRDIFLGRKHSCYPGVLIILEGNDGAGKTTLAHLLVSRMRGAGMPATYVRTPGGTPLGEELRDILLNTKYNIHTLSEFLLFQAQLSQCIEEVIKPRLESGKIVICDRLIFSTLAYQAIGREMDLGFINMLQNKVLDNVWPSFGFMLYNSIKKKSDGDRMESAGIEFSWRVEAFYNTILQHNQSASELMIPISVQNDPSRTMAEIWRETVYQLKR